jgi:hypothetical protein
MREFDSEELGRRRRDVEQTPELAIRVVDLGDVLRARPGGIAYVAEPVPQAGIAVEERGRSDPRSFTLQGIAERRGWASRPRFPPAARERPLESCRA